MSSRTSAARKAQNNKSHARQITRTLTAVALTCLVAAPAAAAPPEVWTVRDGSVAINGGGYGHGKGMSQYGAQGAALQGKSYRDILSFYYPGATMSKATSFLNRPLRVLLDNHAQGKWFRIASTGGDVIAKDDSTGQTFNLGDAPYFRVWPASGGRWTLQRTDAKTFSDDVHTFSGTLTFSTTGGLLRVVFPDASSGTYRGSVTAKPLSSKVAAINNVSMDDYLRSVVPSESIPSWRAEALKAQAVAARTYAIRYALNRKSYYDVCSTVSCQVYHGASKEFTSTTNAVRATSDQILTSGGKPALTMFSSSNGGQSVGYSSYTTSREDPFDAGSHNPVHSWNKTVRSSAFSAKWPQIGTLRYVEVISRDGKGRFGGRITKARIHGSKGSTEVTGPQLRFGLGLRSELATAPVSPIIGKWYEFDGPAGYFGTIKSDLHTVKGLKQYGVADMDVIDFNRGQIVTSKIGGTHYIIGGVAAGYYETGGPGYYGPPLTDEVPFDGGVVQEFQRATALWTPEGGTHILFGGIRAHFGVIGGIKTTGAPTSGEYDYNGGRAQDFVNGRMVWNSTTGKTTWQPR